MSVQRLPLNVSEPLSGHVIETERLQFKEGWNPDLSIHIASLNQDRIVARRYRIRRVGDFLKELKLTEGRGTGIPKIRRALALNGSPAPVIETNEARTFFLVRIPIHPDFVLHNRVKVQVKVQVEVPVDRDEVQVAVQDSLESLVLTATEQRVLEFCRAIPQAGKAISHKLGYDNLTGNVRSALRHLRELGLLAYTVPDKPNSRLQRYLTTPKGLQYLEQRARE